MKRVWTFAQEKNSGAPVFRGTLRSETGQKSNLSHIWLPLCLAKCVLKKSLIRTKSNKFNHCESIVLQVQIGYSDGPDVNSVRILWYLELQLYFKKYFLSLIILFFTNDFLSSGVTGAPVDIPSILWRPLQAARRGRLVQISILGGAAQFVHNQSQRINI